MRFIDHEVQVEIMDDMRKTALHYASTEGNNAIVKMLLSRGALMTGALQARLEGHSGPVGSVAFFSRRQANGV